MITASSKIRRNYSPLTVACFIKQAADSASISQIFDTQRGTYTPDRENGEYLILQPTVNVYAVDGSMPVTDITKKLKTIAWQYSTDPLTENDWYFMESGSGAEIDYVSTSETFGQLAVTANLDPSTHMYFRFQGVYHDDRRNEDITIYSDPVRSDCVEKALDEVRLYTDSCLNILYNPFFDVSTADLYFALKRGKDIIAFDSTRYQINILSGSTTIANTKSGVVSTDNYLTQCTKETYNSRSSIKVHINKGYGVDSKNYIVQLYDKKAKVTIDTLYISLQRLYPTFDIINTNHAPFEPGKVRKDSCIVTSGRKRVINPTKYLDIDWYVYNASGTAVKMASGESVSLDFSASGLSTLTDSFEQYFNVEYKSTIS